MVHHETDCSTELFMGSHTLPRSTAYAGQLRMHMGVPEGLN